MTLVKTLKKAPVERRRLYLDYSCWMAATETLTDFQVTVTPNTPASPIVVNTAFPDAEHKKLQMFAAGGVVNTSYVLSMVVRTSDGQVKQDDIGLRVVA